MLSEFINDPKAIALWRQEHNDINIVPTEADNMRLMTMVASGDAPDIWRINGVKEIPIYASRKLIQPLDKYIKKGSKLADTADMQPIANVFKWDGKKVGSGQIYGFVKDWSIDTTLMLNKKVLQAAGVPIPAEGTVLTWDEVKEIAKKVVVVEQGAVKRYGFSQTGAYSTLDMLVLQMSQLGKSIWNDDFSQINLKDPDVKKILEYWLDFNKSYACNSILSPNPDGSGFTNFVKDEMGVLMVGYWFRGMLASREEMKNRYQDDVLALPSPVMTKGQRKSACMSGTGAVVYSNAKEMEAVMTFMDWFFGGKPVDMRAEIGWGLPMWKSKMNLLPLNSPFEKTLTKVNDEDMKVMMDGSQYRINPFLLSTGASAAFDKHFNEVIYDRITIDQVIPLIENEINILIKEGMEQATN
jgi:multiple sugar transport system substrate-binding protein